MIIRRKTVGGKRLSDREPAITDKTAYDASAFLQGIAEFCRNELSGIVELEKFGDLPSDAVIEISTERAAFLLKLIIRLSGEDGKAYVAASSTVESLLLMFRLSRGLPELSEIEEIREVGRSAGFYIRVSEGAIFAETKMKRSDLSLGSISYTDFLSTLISVFYY